MNKPMAEKQPAPSSRINRSERVPATRPGVNAKPEPVHSITYTVSSGADVWPWKWPFRKPATPE